MLRLAIAQLRPRKGAYDENLCRLGALFREMSAWAEPPELVVAPEAALTGYFLEGGVRDLALPADRFFDDLTRRSRRIFRTIAISGLYIRSHRNFHRLRDPTHTRQHFVAGNFLSIGVAQGKRDPRAGGRDRAKSGLFKYSRAGHIPGIGQRQNLRPMMHGAKRKRFRFLRFNVWHKSSLEALSIQPFRVC